MATTCINCGYPDGSRYVYTGKEDFFTSAISFSSHNNPPLDHQIQAIRDSLTHVRSHLSLVDDKIGRLSAAFKDLTDEREMLQKCVDEHESALSPMRRLPTEIVSEIFLSSLTSEASDSLDAAKGPWRLGKVCSRWRRIVNSYPKFWSSLIIEVDDIHLFTNAITMLETWLLRSRDCLLSIQLSSSDSKAGHAILDLLTPHSIRWKNVDFNIPLGMFLRLVNVKGRLPILEKLVIRRACKDRQPMENIHAFEDAPLLRDLAIVNMFCFSSSHFKFIKAPWSQLLRYEAADSSVEDHLQTLALTLNLTECIISSEVNRFTDTHVSLLKLRKISWIGAGLPSTNLTTPGLEEVRMNCTNKRQEDAMRRLTTFVGQSRCSLKVLRIDMPVTRSTNFVHLLRLSPALINLHIRLTESSSNTIISSLQTPAGNLDACLVPNLTHLSVVLSTPPRQADSARGGLDYLLLMDMVESRWRVVDGRPVSRLRMLQFDDKDFSAPPRPLRRLVGLRHEGLEVLVAPSLLRDEIFGRRD